MLSQYTYTGLKREADRSKMLIEPVAEIGTQSGNFGPFVMHGRVVTHNGVNKLAAQVEFLKKQTGMSAEQVYELMPTLKEIIEGKK